jgi:hypothetical protein
MRDWAMDKAKTCICLDESQLSETDGYILESIADLLREERARHTFSGSGYSLGQRIMDICADETATYAIESIADALVTAIVGSSNNNGVSKKETLRAFDDMYEIMRTDITSRWGTVEKAKLQ